MTNDVTEYVTKRKQFQWNKYTNRQVREAIVVTSTASSNFERVRFDIMGPLPTCNEYKYILTLQCDLLKFVELISFA